MFVGVILGTYGGNLLDETTFKTGMACLILLTTALLFYLDAAFKNCPYPLEFGSSLGILAGFTTMIGNLAGAVTNIYFLSMHLPKNVFIGTSAYVFFIINLFKIPFHIWVWKPLILFGANQFSVFSLFRSWTFCGR